MSGGDRTEVQTTLPDSGAARSGPPTTLAAGTKIGRFTVQEPLGAGGMGIVVAAHDPQLDRRVALKVVRGDVVQAQGRDRLLREGQAMARLSHPNVLTVYEAITIGDDVALVMELVDGQTLRKWLGPGHGWREVVDVFVAIGRGLTAAHRAGLVHRDFKPDNVLIGNDGRARVMDFGLVASHGAPATDPALAPSDGSPLTADLTRTGMIFGTPIYMSPEQHLGAEVDARADQWAFCVSLYEALWGNAPFEGKSMMELRSAVLDGRVREPAERAGVPSRLRTIVLRGLRRDPADRHPSMESLVGELAALAAPRRRIGFAAAVVGMAAAAGALAFALAPRDTEPDRCANAAAPVDAVWNDAARDRVRGSLAAVPRAGAAETSGKVVMLLDARAAAWRSLRLETCRATWKDGTQTASMLELKSRCLDRRLGELGAMIAGFSEHADAETVDRAVAVATDAIPLDACKDDERLTVAYPPPADRAERERLDALEDRLDTVEISLRLGRYPTATELLDPLLAEIRSAAYPPLLARALAERAQLHRYAGDDAAAEKLLRETILVAAEARDSEREADAWRALAMILAFARRPEEALAALEPARAALVRYGNPPRERALLLEAEGAAYFVMEQFDQAKPPLEQALALQREARAPDPEIIEVLQTLAEVNRYLGDYEAAEALARESVALGEKSLGREHPDTIESLRLVGVMQSARADLDGAAATIADALARAVSVHGEHSLPTARIRAELAELAASRGDFAEARRLFEAALVDLQPNANDHIPTLMNYCSVWSSTGEGKDWGAEGEAICGRALEASIDGYGADHPRTALTRVMLASTRLIQGEAAEAEADLRAAEAKLAGHPYGLYALDGLAKAEAAQKKYPDAVATLLRLIASLEQGDIDPRFLVETRTTLAATYAAWGKRKQAIAEAEKALELAKQPEMPPELGAELEELLETLRGGQVNVEAR